MRLGRGLSAASGFCGEECKESEISFLTKIESEILAGFCFRQVVNAR